jgi:uncharacterized protein YfaT (DUF1175 family)
VRAWLQLAGGVYWRRLTRQSPAPRNSVPFTRSRGVRSTRHTGVRSVPLAARTYILSAVVALCAFASSSAQVRLADESDRAAFRAWFVLLADLQFERADAEITDCAALVRYAFREALRAHTPEWARRVGLPFAPQHPDVRSAPRPTAEGWPLFRVAAGDAPEYAEFADARTLIRFNTRSRGRDADAAQPGDLLYYYQRDQRQPDHLMIFLGRSTFEAEGHDWVVYHTGPIGNEPGEVRKVRLSDLARHPAPRWRPEPTNDAFVGVFRLALL